MIKKINCFLRTVFIIVGAFAIIFKLTENKTVRKERNHGYSSEVYDDIW